MWVCVHVWGKTVTDQGTQEGTNKAILGVIKQLYVQGVNLEKVAAGGQVGCICIPLHQIISII